eukprot:scaffold2296_cov92-Cylindrotheca_fusiformis.AAC.1
MEIVTSECWPFIVPTVQVLHMVNISPKHSGMESYCDLVRLAFDSTKSASLAYSKHLEEMLLPDDIARV